MNTGNKSSILPFGAKICRFVGRACLRRLTAYGAALLLLLLPAGIPFAGLVTRTAQAQTYAPWQHPYTVRGDEDFQMH